MMKISVLIPSYKPMSYVKRCFQSLDSQTLSKQKFKVYIALNGPKDNYYDFLNQILITYSFQYELFYLPEANVSKARNFLIDNSKELFITFIDDDDCISEKFLEELLDVVSEDSIGISNLYNFEHEPCEKKINYIGRTFPYLDDRETSKFKSRKYFSSACAKLIHRNIIDEVKFNPYLAKGEDSLFMAQLSKNVRSVKKTSKESIYYVHERQGSVTRRKINKKEEFKRLFFLLGTYSKMLFSLNYNTIFIFTRILATLKHGTKLLK